MYCICRENCRSGLLRNMSGLLCWICRDSRVWVESRIYPENYFEPNGVETDKILYLALMDRTNIISNRNRESEERGTQMLLMIKPF